MSTCYYVKLQVNLSEEDNCLYERYGLSLFDIIPADCKKDCKNNTELPPLDNISVPEALIINVSIDKCDRTKATFLVYVRLDTMNGEVRDDATSKKYKIICGNSNSGTVLKTFEVHPLDKNSESNEQDTNLVLSSGIFTKCGDLEMFRVGDLVQKDGLPVSSELPNIGVDGIRIISPLTKELKCLIPDFGLTNPIINEAVNGILKVPVRVVAKGQCNLVLPAFLTYNKKDCNVCLEMSLSSNDAINSRYITTHNDKFGVLGCNALLNFNEDRLNICEKDDKFEEKFNLMFLAKKLDVMGVDKCCEQVLFSFQVCYEPHRRINYNNTVLEHDKLVDEMTGSFRIQSEATEYCYEVFGSEIIEPTSTSEPSSPTTND